MSGIMVITVVHTVDINALLFVLQHLVRVIRHIFASIVTDLLRLHYIAYNKIVCVSDIKI